MLLLSSKSCYPISCNFPSPPKTLTLTPTKTQFNFTPKTLIFPKTLTPTKTQFNFTPKTLIFPKTLTPTKTHFNFTPKTLIFPKTLLLLRTKFQSLQVCHDSINQEPKGPLQRSGDGGSGNDWSTSVLLFGFWAGLMFYVFRLTPDQTPIRDMYFLQKLLNLKGDDGFRMNEVLVGLWYIMGLWPLIYSMLLLPSGRSSKNNVPVWPFLVLSCFGGAYALIPYFVLWKPPPPPVEEDEISRWPLNFLESKITAAILLAAGLGVITYAVLATPDAWKEFYQYFRESKFIHVMSLDFSLLSAFAPFWVYNDMTARKWIDKGSWLLPVAIFPFLGPSLYLLLRPPLSSLPTSVPSTSTESD